MNKLEGVQALWKCFYSAALYRKVGVAWKGAAVGYLALVIGIFCVVYGVGMQIGFNKFVDVESPEVVAQIPEIVIENGLARTPEKRPYVIFAEMDGKRKEFAIIDTTQKTIPPNLGGVMEFLAETQFGMKKNSRRETRVYDLSEVKSFAIDQGKVKGWLGLGKSFLVLLTVPFMFAGLLAFRLIQALLFSLAGMILGKIKKVSLPYPVLFRLSVVAMTPGMLLGLITEQLKLHIPWSAWIFILLGIGYLAFAMRRVDDSEGEDPAAIAR